MFVALLHMFDGQRSTTFSYPARVVRDEPKNHFFGISGACVDFSGRFCGISVGFLWLRILALEASSHSWMVFVVFRGNLTDAL